ncbi:PIF1-like helicase [Medicago truncatula]|uniref:PIF1-like helicase n=1 Tax=Medicago truncatula TaxID=3880 RepID=A0A0C3X061_MEDTR|nr:PIF1-like helicase [Medicago truncatula]
MVPGEEKVYLSYDSPIHYNLNGDHIDDVHTPEFLNTITASGLSNRKLRLKVGVPVMLLRNIDTRYELCNGTRLVITRMRRYVIEGRVISGSNVGDQIFVSRLSISPSDVRIPFKFQQRQFSLTVSFAMTINKSQGQSLKHVGVYNTCIFSRTICYKVMSSVREVVLEERESLWFRVLRARYGVDGGRLMGGGRGSSLWWLDGLFDLLPSEKSGKKEITGFLQIKHARYYRWLIRISPILLCG